MNDDAEAFLHYLPQLEQPAVAPARGRSRDTQTQQDTQPQRYATAATVPH